MIKVTPIPTGKAWMKSAQKCGGEGRNAFQRKLDIFRDKNWVGPLEIFAWLIEHPEGKFIVDTGDSAENSTPRLSTVVESIFYQTGQHSRSSS